MRRTGQLIATLLLFIVISLPALLFFHSSFQLFEHKEQMERKILEVESIELKVPASSISWEMGGKEIRINGKLFDLLSIEFDGNFAYCKGIFDEEEELLEARLEQLLQHTSDGARNRNLSKQWLGILMQFKPVQTLLPDILVFQIPKHLTRYLLPELNRQLEINERPPEC